MFFRIAVISVAMGLSAPLIAAEGGSLGPSASGAASASPTAGTAGNGSNPAAGSSSEGANATPGNVRNPAIRGATLGGGPEDAFNGLDRDKDGEISQQEGDQDPSLSSNRAFEQADVNKDGRLDPSEHSQTR